MPFKCRDTSRQHPSFQSDKITKNKQHHNICELFEFVSVWDNLYCNGPLGICIRWTLDTTRGLLSCTGSPKLNINSHPTNSCSPLTHWGRVTHICVGNLTIIDSDNGLSPGRRQAIIWTNAAILSIGPLGTNLNEISSGIQTFAFSKMHFKMSSAKWRPFCLGLNVLISILVGRDLGVPWLPRA